MLLGAAMVARATVGRSFFAEVVEHDAHTASIGGESEAFHRFDTSGESFALFFVNRAGDDDVFRGRTRRSEINIRCGFSWHKVDNVHLGEQ